MYLLPVCVNGEAHEAVPEDPGDDEADEDGQEEHGVRGEDPDLRHLLQADILWCLGPAVVRGLHQSVICKWGTDKA